MYGPPIGAVHGSSDIDRLRVMTHIDDEEDEEDTDVVRYSNGDESLKSPTSQIRYDNPNNTHSLVACGGDVMDSIDAAASDALYPSELPPSTAGDSSADQLTLSFRGEVYVFDSVSVEKVQAVLLLLGGYELPTGIPSRGMTSQNHRNVGEYPARSSLPQRAASLNRFREKRKERCFEKKIRYTVRKEVALRMQRKKGQFTSAKTVSDEAGSSSADGNGSSGPEEQETLCRHCGINSKSTPMMRRGPDGPRTLCNACGLKWANKGILRDLSKVPLVAVQHHMTNPRELLMDGQISSTGAGVGASGENKPIVSSSVADD